MEKTLHDLHLKGLVLNKKTHEIVAAFISTTEAIGFKNELNGRHKENGGNGEPYEYKESY